jgi:hypothetical protein
MDQQTAQSGKWFSLVETEQLASHPQLQTEPAIQAGAVPVPEFQPLATMPQPPPVAPRQQVAALEQMDERPAEVPYLRQPKSAAAVVVHGPQPPPRSGTVALEQPAKFSLSTP